MLNSLNGRYNLRNSILSGLPPDEFDAIRPLLSPFHLRERAVLQEHKKRIQHVDFIESGIISSRTVASGSILETAMLGFRGATGISVTLGWNQSLCQTTVVAAGTALRIDVDDLQRVMRAHPVIREHLLRHVHALIVHTAQNALCGTRHKLEQRMACWLSLAHNALGGCVLPITHDDLSIILGLRRASVTEALSRFESRGLIRKTRGVIELTDCGSLKQMACVCFHIIENAYLAADSFCRSGKEVTPYGTARQILQQPVLEDVPLHRGN